MAARGRPVLAACLLCSFGAAAQPVVLDAAKAAGPVDLAGVTQLLEDPDGQLTLDQVRSAAHRARFRPGSPKLGMSLSAHWMRYTVARGSAPADWWFDSGNRVVREISLFAPDSAGVYREMRSGSTQRFGERPLPTATFVFPISLPQQSVDRQQVDRQPVDIYVRVRSTAIVVLAPKLWRPDDYLAAAGREKVTWFIYLGMAGALCLFNLLMFVSLREITHLLYAFSLLSIVWAVSSAAGGYGAAYQYLWPDWPAFEEVSWVLSIVCASFFSVYFMSRFTGIDRAMPRVYRTAMAGIVSMAVCLVLQTVVRQLALAGGDAAIQVVFVAGLTSFLPLFPCMAYGLASLSLRGNRQARFVLLAFAPMMAAALLVWAELYSGRQADLAYLMWGSAIELVLMSLAVADRYNQERAARIQAQAELVAALRESERALEEKVILRTAELRGEQVRTKDLLHNILPVELADELTATGSARPARHEAASILFTDFSGFTQAVSTMPADRMVAELNDIFAAFDDITDACGVEKIKTIGDAYMAAAGLPKPCDDHALRCVSAGLLMLAFVESRNLTSAFKWSLRVGIHSGPVVAGVVGKRKYAFDIWGDSVNVASRMESSGAIGRVNVSAYTYELIRKQFDCEYRGKIAAKGKGDIDMYFVLVERKEARKEALMPG